MLNQCLNRDTLISSRKEYIQNLQNFTERSRASIDQFIKDIGGVQDDKIPKPSHQNMAEKEEEYKFSEEPNLPCISSRSKFVITIDAEKQKELLKPFWKQAGEDLRQPPSSAGELIAHFTKQERIVLYEHALKNTPVVAKPPELLSLEDVLQYKDQPSDEKLTSLEMKKALRDLKRRRQAYRTKVSTKNKSQTQVTREIINNMMVFLGAEEVEQETNEELQSSAIAENRPVASRYSSKREPADYQRNNGSSSYKRSHNYREDSQYNIREDKCRKDYEEYHYRGHGNNKYRYSTTEGGKESKIFEIEKQEKTHISEPSGSKSARKYKTADYETSRSKDDLEKPEASESDDNRDSTNSRERAYKAPRTAYQESDYRTKNPKHKRKSKKSHNNRKSKTRD